MNSRISCYVENNKVSANTLIFRNCEEFLRILFADNGHVKMIVWYEYCMVGEQKLGMGGYKDTENSGYMWAETQLFETGLQEKPLSEILAYISETRAKYTDIDLYPEFFIKTQGTQKITLCGDNCLECPRYLAQTEDELKKVAELWYRVGWRDTIVSVDEIRCTGCSSRKKCTYQLVECIKEKGIEKCSQCPEFPCQKISDMLERSQEYQKKCREVCYPDEYEMLERSFFRKEENLKK